MNPRSGEELQAEFLRRLAAKLKKGEIDYGPKSFFAEPAETLEEILQEVEDMAGWSYVLWVQTKIRLEGLVLRIEQKKLGDMERHIEPLVKGGQGKSDQQVKDSSDILQWVLYVAVMVAAGGFAGWLLNL